MKTCCRCHCEKPEDQFKHNRRTKDGRDGACKLCVYSSLKEIRHQRREQRREELLRNNGKRCTRCSQHKPTEEFSDRNNTIDGLHSWCKECIRNKPRDAVADARNARAAYWRSPEKFRARAVAYVAKNPERAREAQRRHRKHRLVERWPAVLALSARATAARKNLGVSDIDAVFILDLFEKQGGRCYWLGIPLVASSEQRDPRRPSLDRLDNAKGYVRGNVVLACMFANMGRSAIDAGQFAKFIDELKSHLKH